MLVVSSLRSVPERLLFPALGLVDLKVEAGEADRAIIPSRTGRMVCCQCVRVDGDSDEIWTSSPKGSVEVIELALARSLQM